MPAEMSCPTLPLQPSGSFGNPCLRMHATNASSWRCCCSCCAGDSALALPGEQVGHAALVDWGASKRELFDGFTMKTPELLGSG